MKTHQWTAHLPSECNACGAKVNRCVQTTWMEDDTERVETRRTCPKCGDLEVWTTSVHESFMNGESLATKE